MRISRYIAAGISATAMLGFYGCSGNIDSGVPSTASSTTEQVVNALGYIGSPKCIECHEARNPTLVSDYLAGIHVVHGTGVTAASGEACLQCHDPIGDGPLIEGRVAAANVPADGLAAVGCEGCHGNESGHYRVVYPEAATCGQCHDANHITDNPEGNNIYSDYLAGNKHSKAPTHLEAPCVKCHTDEGGRMYKDIHTVGELALVQPLDAASPIQCRTCHNAHNPDKLMLAANGTGSAQYNTCTNCHQRHDAQVGVAVTPLPGSTSTDGSSGDLIYHGGRWTRVISSTHYDNPATADIIEGYNLNPASDRVCLDCHNVHSADITINEQWARSGHGGKILEAKEAAAASQTDRTIAQVIAVRAAGADITTGAAWVEEGNAAASTSCRRCHTATGAASYLNAPASYDAAALTPAYAYLAGEQREMLYCWGCHKNNSGDVRTPGAITAGYNFNSVPAVFPTAESSNTCIACHAGRESGESVEAITDFTNVSFKNSHYLAAAGLMYVKIGYRNFVPLDTVIGTTTYGATLTSTEDGGSVSSTHRKLGTVAINGDSHNTAFFVPGNLDSAGPCVTCHMAARTDNLGKRSHTLEIDGNAFTTVCGNCHTAEGATTLTAANFKTVFVEEQAIPFQNALDLAKAKLMAVGITYDSAVYPYFFPNAALVHDSTTGVKDWTLAGAVDGQKMMGACFNINLLSHEPAAYAHARTYTRRLLYDTIDWLDNRVIDRSVSVTAIAWDPVKYTAGADANDAATTESMKYLKSYDRTSGAWKDPERP